MRATAVQMTNEIVPIVEAAGLQVSYSSERSVQDELNEESFADAGTVALSYLAMFIYIAFAMAKAPPTLTCASAMVRSRAGLGLAGVCIVLCSVLGALGICSLFGLWGTLIIMEVRSCDCFVCVCVCCVLLLPYIRFFVTIT